MGWRRRGCVASMLGFAAGKKMGAWLELAVGWRRGSSTFRRRFAGLWPVEDGAPGRFSLGVWPAEAGSRRWLFLPRER